MKNELQPIFRASGITVVKHGIPTLHGKGNCNDAPALHTLLNGGCAFDARSTGMIAAPTLAALPPGLYSLTDARPIRLQKRSIGPH